MLLPYRSNKKIESFPYGTVAIVAINLLVYAFTTDYFLVINERSLNLLAVSHETIWTQPWRMLSAMFLHGGLSHLLGNLMSFAVFGPAVEGRLRTGKFVAYYLLAGLLGGIFEDLVIGFGNPAMKSLGASGAIMGVLGMYLYMFPHSKVKILFWFFRRPKTYQWKASWCILYYVIFDIWSGFQGASDGVGHLTHLGGMAAGWLTMMLTQVVADTADQSRAEELLSAADGNLHMMPITELAAVYTANPNNPEVALAYCMRTSRDGARRRAVQVMIDSESAIAECDNPHEIAYIILSLSDLDGNPPPWLMFKLARRLADKDPALAEPLYWRILKSRPRPEGELLEKTLLQLAALLEIKDKQKEEASALYYAVLQLFPVNDSATIARFKVKQLGRPRSVAFSLMEGKIVPVENTTAQATVRSDLPPLPLTPTATNLPPPAIEDALMNVQLPQSS